MLEWGVWRRKWGKLEVAMRSQEGDRYICRDIDIDIQIYVCLSIYPHIYIHTYDSIELVVNYY